MSSTPSVIPADVRLKRFLHYGREVSVYTSGYLDFHEYYEMSNMNAVEEIVANSGEDKHADIVTQIIKAATDGYAVSPNCLAFTLAVCARQKTSQKLRHAAYDALSTVCKTPKELFAFVNFANKLTTGTKGWGAGIRTAISNWYLKRDAIELAEFVSKYRGFFNWTHRDLVKLVHPKTTEPEKEAILRYIMRGLEAAQAEAAKDDEKTQKVLEYLEKIESFKKETEPDSAANLISVYGYSVEMVPQHNTLIKSHQVWMALVKILPLGEILENLKRLSCYGFLKANEPMEKLLVERFKDKASIKESKLHPFEVYIYLRRYEEHAKDQAEKMTTLVKAGRVAKIIKPAPKPNPKIVAALNSLLNATCKLIVPTNLRYVVAVDLSMRHADRVVGAAYVSALQAAVLLILTLLKTEKSVKIVTFPYVEESNYVTDSPTEPSPPPVMFPLTIDTKLSVQANVDKLKEIKAGRGNIEQPLLWAIQEKVPADVFMVLSASSLGQNYDHLVAEYRAAVNLPDLKFIEHVFSSMMFKVNDSDVKNFHLIGFGGNVGKMIEAFLKGAF